MTRRVWVAALAIAFVLLNAPPTEARQVLPSPRGAAPCTDQVGPGIPAPPGVAALGLDGYHAAFYGQSGYPVLCTGSSARATIAFLNTGALGWHRDSAPVYLGTWGPEPGQDRPSALGGDGTQGSPATGWPSYNRVAAQPAPYVGPGQVAWFQFTVRAPQTPGVYRLALRPLIEGVQWLEDFGVFWYVTVKADDLTLPAPPAVAPKEPARTYFPAVVDGARTIRVPVLMYHHVESLPPSPDRFRVDLTVRPQDFEEQLRWLRAQGYATVTSNELWWTLDQGAPLPAKPVQLTFDDGYADAYTVVLPLLRKYGFVGTFFVTANLVGRPGYLNRDQVRALATLGMDVQSHAVDHFSLMRLPRAAQEYQLCVSRKILSEWLGKDVRHFAFPAGDWNATTLELLPACGYLSAYRKSGGSLQTSNAMLLLQRERVRGQQGLAALLTALSR